MNIWLRRKVHVSWLVATISLGVIIGVISSPEFTAGTFGSFGWLLAGLALAGCVAWWGRRWCLLLALLAGLLIGIWRGSIVQAELAPYDGLIGSAITLHGSVAEDVDIGKSGDLLLRLKDIEVEGRALPGMVWATLPAGPDIKRGDRVTLSGLASEGFGSFATSLYRTKLIKHERPQPGDVARRVRDSFADKVRQGIPEPQASLGIGYLVGQRRALPMELDEALRIAGLTHVVVASGYNLTILVRLARRLFVKVSKYLATLSASAMVVAFMAVTGISPSMSRAGLVAGLSLLAWYYGRRFHPLVLVSFAAAVTLIINPSYGWNDLGWQLSFAAFAGVMIMGPLLQAYFFGSKKPGTIRQILGETISAQLFTLPIIAATFGVFSNVSLLANLLVLPLVPFAMLLTFIAGIAAIVLPAAASLIALPATWLLGYMTETATRLANLSWAQADVDVGAWMVLLAYIVIVAICVYMWRKTGLRLQDTNLVE